jgi:hypothetical protein
MLEDGEMGRTEVAESFGGKIALDPLANLLPAGSEKRTEERWFAGPC